MAIGQIHMLTPLLDRIDRWATSGKATKVPLHPEDWDRISDSRREKLEAKYKMSLVCLGGEKAYIDWKHRTKSEEQREEMMQKGEL